MMKKITFLLLATALWACGKKDNPNLERPDEATEIWYPEKSQPGVFKVPDALKNHNNDYAKQTHAGIAELEDLISAYNAYFLAPEGTKNTSLTLALGYQYDYLVDGHTVKYMYGDFSSTHRVFELEVVNSTGGRIVFISGSWWENWNAEDGRTENGRHYGQMRYEVGEGDSKQAKEFSWIDDGGGDYRVSFNIWNPGGGGGLAAKYEYTFNADQSGKSMYQAELPEGGYAHYQAAWMSNGSGAITFGEGGNAKKHEW